MGWVRLLLIGALGGVAACASQARGGIVPDDVPDDSRCPAGHGRPPDLKVQLAYQVGPAPECSNWYAALRKARNWAGCDLVTNMYKASSRNSCQERVQGCRRGCDLCPILSPGAGPPAEFDDFGELVRDGNTVAGTRAKQSVGRTFSIFNTRLCDDLAWVDVLGSTMIHEAMHHCHSGLGITDLRSSESGCSANSLERFCTGISSPGGN